jgi:hypothetical protein
MEPGVDVFLPFWWIAKHPPQGAWTNEEIRFNAETCRKNCTKQVAADFSLDLDESIITNSEARIIGYVSAIDLTDGSPSDPLE